VALDAGPRSVQEARRWVVRACHALDRADLAECAESGISELVTNALLHGEPPISVRLRGTNEHPRVEVYDGSGQPPMPRGRPSQEDEVLSTVGRGLEIVARCSRTWGAEPASEGKLVWFEPADALTRTPDLGGNLVGFEPRPPALMDEGADESTRIHLRHLPVALFADFRNHFEELRRELRILSFAHEDEYPVAKRLAEVFSGFEDIQRGSAETAAVDEARASEVATVDVSAVVPRERAVVMAQMIDLLELADAFCRSKRLLSLATTDQQQQFQRWYLGEYVNQARGAEPLPWAGERQVVSQNAS